MSTQIFISYSRQEIHFVDQLSKKLAPKNIDSWIDYKDLVPGQRWDTQLKDAIASSKTFLLVVSRSSMQSKHVRAEWEQALKMGKRLILIIFEAAEMDQELEELEWVDFRRPFRSAIAQLLQTMEKAPASPKERPPQKSLRLPPLPLLFLIFSTISVFGFIPLTQFLIDLLPQIVTDFSFSIESAQTAAYLIALLPFIAVFFIYLIPLPYQFWKRNYEYRNTSRALAVQTLTFVLLAIFSKGIPFLISSIIALILFILPGMKRWAGPDGAKISIKIANASKYTEPESVKFSIEFASEDRVISQFFIERLEEAGHKYLENPEEADTILVILSKYHQSTQLDPEEKMIIPVIVQTCDADEKLSRTQWLDFRSGVSKKALDLTARLLDRPRELLSALGVLPVQKLKRPTAVNLAITGFQFFLTNRILSILIIIYQLGTLVKFTALQDPSPSITLSAYVMTLPIILSTGIAFWLILNAIKTLSKREGNIRSFWVYWLVALGMILIPYIIASPLSMLNSSIAGAIEHPGAQYEFGRITKNVEATVNLIIDILLVFLVLPIFSLNIVNRWLPRPVESAPKNNFGRNVVLVSLFCFLLVLGLSQMPELKIPRYIMAGQSYESYDLEQSIYYYSKALEINPETTEAYLLRGVAYVIKGEESQNSDYYEEAINDFNVVINLYSNNGNVYYLRGLAYYDLGEYQQAISDLDQAIELGFQTPEAYYFHGVALLILGEETQDFDLIRQAISDFDTAIELNPQYTESYYFRGLAYFDLGEYQLAFNDLDQAIEQGFLPPKAYFFRGRCLLILGERAQDPVLIQRSLEDFNAAQDFYPEYVEVHFYRGIAYFDLGEYQLAVTDLAQSIAYGFLVPEAYYHRGIAYLQIGNIEQGIYDLEIAYGLTENPQIKQSIIDILVQYGD